MVLFWLCPIACICLVVENEAGFFTIFFFINAAFIAETVDAIGLASVEFHIPA